MGTVGFLLVAIAVVVVLVFLASRKRPERRPTVSVTVASGEARATTGGTDTGDLAAAGEGAWVLNPKAPLPLTLLGASRDVAEKMRVLLHTPGTWDVKKPEVTHLIARHNLRFKEIEEFITQLRPRFMAELERQKKASPEWAGASERDRTDLLAEFEEKAVASLGLNHSSFDLHFLMTGELKHIDEDDRLLERFAGDAALYSLYLGELGRNGRVVTVPSGDYLRAAWEKLVAKGFARRGKDIPKQLLLEGLRLKDLNEIIAPPKPIGRKAKAIEAALALPDLEERLEKEVTFREMFQAVQPEGIDVTALASAFAYADTVARVAMITCYTGVTTLQAIAERREGGYDAYEITNWEDDPPPECARQYLKKYARLPARRPPFHIGCNCRLECTFKDE